MDIVINSHLKLLITVNPFEFVFIKIVMLPIMVDNTYFTLFFKIKNNNPYNFIVHGKFS